MAYDPGRPTERTRRPDYPGARARNPREDEHDVIDVRSGSPETTAAGDHHPAPAADRRRRLAAEGSDQYEQRVVTKPAKTSAAAAVSLVFGTSAVVCLLTLVLTPVAILLGLIAVALGVVGLRMARRRGVTGKAVALTGILLGLVATVMSLLVVAGVTTLLNNNTAVDRIERQLNQLREQLPDSVDVPEP